MTAAGRIPTGVIAQHVSPDRLSALIGDLARFGVLAGGGVNRQALTAEDIEARCFLVERATQLGCSTAMDPAGNMFFRRGGIETDSPAVATGSHIDSQPCGGHLDGAYGVCAGLEVIAALNDAGAATRWPVEVVIWSNEEGCRFSPGSLGAQAFVSPQDRPRLLASTDAGGCRYLEEVERLRKVLPQVGEVPADHRLRTFIEAHIEQGPILEANGIAVGIVTGIQGVRWYRVEAHGEAAHAGTTPLGHRRDAMRACVDLMERLYRYNADQPDLRLTIGRLELPSASINTIPGHMAFTLDARHPQASDLDACEEMLREFCGEIRHGCRIGFETLMSLNTTRFDTGVQDALRRAALDLGVSSMDLMSGAFHDSLHLARHCPTGMVFVPSHRGLSHNPEEYTDPVLLGQGARVLCAALAQCAEATPGPGGARSTPAGHG